MEGRIVKALSGFYDVQTGEEIVRCRARGRFRKEQLTPLVGDLVAISRQGGEGTVTAILPRRNHFLRPAVANLDALVVLASCVIPVTEPFLIDRITAIAGDQNVPVMATSACCAGLRVEAAEATMGADPKPDSLENKPRATP